MLRNESIVPLTFKLNVKINDPNRQKGDFYADFVHVFSYRFNRFSHAKI